jgi:hypothetical protein
MLRKLEPKHLLKVIGIYYMTNCWQCSSKTACDSSPTLSTRFYLIKLSQKSPHINRKWKVLMASLLTVKTNSLQIAIKLWWALSKPPTVKILWNHIRFSAFMGHSNLQLFHNSTRRIPVFPLSRSQRMRKWSNIFRWLKILDWMKKILIHRMFLLKSRKN